MGSSPPSRQRKFALPPSRLTARELEIAAWLGEDIPVREIGRRLGISFYAVRRHVRRIQEKLGVKTRHAAVARLAAKSIPVLTRPILSQGKGSPRGD